MEMESHRKNAATMACDLVRQFINIAVGGMAFALGLSLAVKISLWFLWFVLIVFGISVAVGLLFQMHFIALVWRGDFSIYSSTIRLLASCQILLVAFGILLLCFAIC